MILTTRHKYVFAFGMFSRCPLLVVVFNFEQEGLAFDPCYTIHLNYFITGLIGLDLRSLMSERSREHIIFENKK